MPARFSPTPRRDHIALSFFLLLLWSAVGHAQIKLAQHTNKDAGTVASSALAFPAANTAGNFVAVAIRAGRSNQVFTLTDTRGNTYRKAVQFNVTLDAPNGNTAAIYYAENVAGGANTVTVALSTSATLRFATFEYSGVATANSLDGTAAAQGTSAAANSGNATTTNNGDLLLGLIETANGATYTAGIGYTIEDRVPAAPNTKLIGEDQIQAVAGTASASATFSSSDVWGAVLGAFRPASGGGGSSPTITNLNPTSGPVGTQVTITGTNFGASGTVTFNNITAATTSWSATSIVTSVPTGATTGNVVVTVGGVASNGANFIVSPVITNLNPTSGPAGTQVTIAGTNFGASGTVTFNNITAATTSWNATSIVTSVPAGATTGNVVVTVSGVASNGMAFTVSPAITNLNPTSGPVGTPVTITGTNFGASGTVTFNNITATTTSWSATSISTSVPSGATTGNVVVTTGGLSSSGVNFTVGAPPPNITNLNPTSGPVGTPVTITGTNFGASGTVTFNNITAATTSWSATSISTSVPSGATTGNVVVTSGGVSSSGVNFTVSPAITNLNPTSGPVGTQVTITGTNFGASGTVTFNNITAATMSWSATSIVTSVPTGATTGNVVVTTGGVASSGVNFTVSPAITNLNPNTGPVGTQVTITGTNFGASGTVTFNNITAATTSWSATSIVTSVPTGATTGSVVVTTGGLSSSGVNFTVGAPPPNITNLNPNSGPVGTPVTITGTNFGASGTVTFNNTTAATTSWSATSISTSVPTGATTGNVVVTVGGVASSGVNFIVSPAITTLNPTSGPAGTQVTITGTNFGASGTVTFNNTTATTTSWSATSIVTSVPAGATTGNVVVTVSGVASNGVAFTVSPTITNLNPSSGPVGTPVTITGTNFGASGTVTFNNITATTTSWSATSISTSVPSGATTGNVVVTTGGLTSNGVNFTVGSVQSGITLVQHMSKDAGTTSSSALAFTFANTVGNFIAVAIRAGQSNQVLTISDSRGNTYRKAVQFNVSLDIPNGDTTAIYYAENIAGGANTVTVNLSVSGTLRFGIFEYSGVAGTNSLDGTASAQGTSAAPSSGNATTTNNGDLLFGAIITSGTATFTAGAGYKIEEFAPAAPNTKLIAEDEIQTTAGPVSANATLAATDVWGAVLAAFKPGVGCVVSISPPVIVLTSMGTQQFSSCAANAVWSVDGVVGGSAASGTITAAGLYTPPAAAGPHTVTASNGGQSANATAYVSNYPGTFTRDIDNLRTGSNPNEFILTPANVNVGQFGKLFNYAIDGTADASPLYVANVNIPGQGFHNVVYVATEHDSVYAFDADGRQSTPLWQLSFINPAAGITTVPPNDTGECCDIFPEIGITGTPVIDPATNTLYVVVKTKEVVGGSTNYYHRLHALDLATGAEKLGGPVFITATLPGNGAGSVGGQITFLNLRQNQRSALLLNNGVVYIAFGAHGDNSPYHGWILGYNAATLQRVMAYMTSPNDNGNRPGGGGQGSGVWMSGDGLATDANGNIFFVTGNGIFDVNTGGPDYGDSLLKISPTGTVLDYFTPHDQANMNAADLDLGSGGTLVLPDQPGTHPHLALTAGKGGTIYLIDRDNMGHYNPNNDNAAVQTIVNIFPNGNKITGNFKAPLYWNGHLYYSADADFIKTFSITNGLLSTSPTSQSSWAPNYPGATLGMSSNGNSNAILWAIQRVDFDPFGGGTKGPGSLHAFDATNLANELYTSNQNASRDQLDFTAKWSAPLVANGKVFVASEGFLTGFGLLAASGGGTAPTITTLNPTSGPVGTQVTITGTNFAASGTVTFNNITATTTSWSATSISASVPTGATTGSVVVTTGGLSSNAVTFTVGSGTSAPNITNLNPASGPVGTPVTITGTNFGASGTVTFNNITAATTSWSATSIVTSVPAGATTGNVVVTVGGVASNGANFIVSPVITNLNPASGPAGTQVTITGTNFGASGTVTFNNTAAATTSWSASSIVTSVPAGATTGNVVVTVSGVASNGMAFTVSPAITNLNPTSGPVGTPVTITGTNFGASGTVTFNNITATTTSWSATSISTSVPSGATTGNVVVTTGGLSSSGVNFTVGAPPPNITNLNPNIGPVATPVTITGTNFGASGTVTFNNITATTTSWSATSISTSVPSGATTGNVVVTSGGVSSNGVNFTVGSPPAGITLIQHTSKDAGNTASSSLAFSSANTAGNFIAVAIRAGLSNEVFTITDSRGNTYRKAVQFNVSLDVPNGETTAIYYAENVSGGANTVTVALSTSGTLRFGILEYAGVAAANSLDGIASAQGNSASPNSGYITTTFNGDLLFGAVVTSNTASYTAGTGYKTEEFVPAEPNTKLIAEDQIQAATGTASASATLAASDVWSAVLAAFRSSAACSISVSPRVTVLTFTGAQQFLSCSASPTWSVDGIVGGSAAVGTITGAGLYTPPAAAGPHTVTASNGALSSNATVYVSNYSGTFTRDIDNLRTGLNPNETVLTPANVNVNQFGKLFTYSIDGTSDASPLYVANLNIPGLGFRNVVYVATEHDSVYAFDADGRQTTPLWQVSFINPGAGITTVPSADANTTDITPEIGITGSPVIDPATNTLYVVAKTKEVVGGATNYYHRLHALDLATGAEKLGGPVIITATLPGTGSGSSGGQITFNSLRQNQRAALLLNSGVVYVAFGAHGDNSPYHGWILGYNASTLQRVMAYITSPDDNGVPPGGAPTSGQGSGVWMSGDGLAIDATGNIFFVTGNGIFDADTGGRDYGDSFLQISPTGTLQDYFTPHDQAAMNAADLDLGSGGTLVLPDQPGPHPHLALTAGKNGTIYLIDRDNMGHYNPNNDNAAVQTVVNIFPHGNQSTGNFKAPVYWNGHLYYSADADFLKTFSITNGLLSTTPTSQSSFAPNYPGSTLGLSSNGNTNAILWAIERFGHDQFGGGIVAPGVLHALDATNLGNELYNSNQYVARDQMDFSAKWSAPLVANGRVFVASLNLLEAYGLLP